MRLIFFGTPDFAVLPLRTLIKAGHAVAAVVTQPDRKSGRGARLTPPPVKREALEAGIRIFQPVRIREKAFIREMKDLSPEVIVVAAYGKILPPDILSIPRLGCVNIHASLLPKYRGSAPVNWAIIRGESESGVTTMMMDEGMDTGDMLIRKAIEITNDDTAETLTERLSRLGADVIVETIDGLVRGVLMPKPQKGEPSYAPLLKKEDGLIQWTRSAEELERFIRGMNPWPSAFSRVNNERYRIHKAAPVSGSAAPGVIAEITKDALLVGTERGLLSIFEIQPEGKKRMPVRAFLQGRTLKKGIAFHD